MFIRNGDHLTNLDLVATAQVGERNVRGVRPVALRAANGAELGVTRDDEIDTLTAPIVAGAAEAVFIDHTGAARWVPVVAWRLLRHGAEPIFGAPKPGGVMFLRTTEGALIGAGNRYDSLDAATQAVAAVHKSGDDR